MCLREETFWLLETQAKILEEGYTAIKLWGAVTVLAIMFGSSVLGGNDGRVLMLRMTKLKALITEPEAMQVSK